MSASAPVVPFEQGLPAACPEPVGELAIALVNVLAWFKANAEGAAGAAYVPERLLTIEQVADELHCSVALARRWVDSYVPIVKVGDLPRVRRFDLDAVIRRLATTNAGGRR